MKLGFILSEMWTGIRGNFSMVVSIILVTFVSLSFVSVAALLQLQVGNMKNYWYDRAQIAIYLCSDFSPEEQCPAGVASAGEIAAVQATLQSQALNPHIEAFYFESQQDAFDRFLAESEDLSAAQYLLPEQLNQAFWVNLVNPEKTELIVEAFSSQPGVAEVRDQRGYLDQIINFLNVSTLAVAGVAAIMLFSAALLTTTTIRLSAFSRRREISIMRLVGASSASIQLPFILEGLLAALIGGGLAIGVVGFGTQYFVTDLLAEQLAFTSFVGIADVWQIAPAVIGAGALIATLAAAVSTFRHVRV
ncbi:permease-like cell division protein FtsX [Aquiluna sp.]|nr:permease-like cell division protein FtsX [Aquiluna sp.]